MKFRDLDYLRCVPPVKEPVVSLLFFPPQTQTPSGFYLIEPNGEGGNKITLLRKVAVDPRTEKAFYTSMSQRARLVIQGMEDEEVKRALASGARWSSSVAEDLVTSVMEDPSCVVP